MHICVKGINMIIINVLQQKRNGNTNWNNKGKLRAVLAAFI